MAVKYKTKRKRKSVIGTVIFYFLYLLAVAAAIYGILFVLKELNFFLDNYERSLVKYEAEEVFEKYFSPCRFDALYDMQDIELSEFEDKSDFVSYMEKQYNGKEITYKEVSAGLGDNKKYVVAADNVKFAEFYLKKNESPETPEDTWELESVSTHYQKAESVHVKLFTTSKLYLNDIELGEAYMTEDKIQTETCTRVPEGVDGIMYREFKVDGLLLPPVLKTVNRHGNESKLIYNEDKRMYEEEIVYDDISAEIRKRATDAAQTYAKYVTLDATLYNVSQYFDTTTDTYRNIMNSETRWYTYHIRYEFKDVELKEYYIYDEDIFSIRYSCNHYVYRTQTDVFNFPLDLTLYFKNINGNFYVYDMISNY